MKPIVRTLALGTLVSAAMSSAQQPANPFVDLMQKAAAHAKAHGALPPSLSPNDATILNGAVPVSAIQAMGLKVVPWTTNDPARQAAVIGFGVDGLISDRPDLLQTTVAGAHVKPGFDVEGHRGGRGLRPENTLPAFEVGMDNHITTIETDTGVTADHVSIIWHDQFLNPLSCRRADGKPYKLEGRVYHQEITIKEAQATFVCDKLKTNLFPDQKNDLALSPVAVAFAEHEHLISPYVPTYVEQLFRFASFYAEYYSTGLGKNHPDAAARARTGASVHFNLETKILPEDLPAGQPRNHTFGPQVFVDTLCGAIRRNHMEARSDVQSFDFRTLILVEEQFPAIPTYYLTEGAETLSSALIPVGLRQP